MKYYKEYCSSKCLHVAGFSEGNWTKYCDRFLIGNQRDFEFTCDSGRYHHVTSLCDEVSDCRDGADEKGCPGRFYCDPDISNEWVPVWKQCDFYKDCKNGADECATCGSGDDVISSDESLIKSGYVTVATACISMLIVVLNGKQVVKCWNMKSTSAMIQVERLQLINVFAHDLLMGLYLAGIVMTTIIIRIRGRYCVLEDQWRSSWVCSLFGVIFSSSVHGSLATIAFMSYTRSRVCCDSHYHAKRSTGLIALISLNLINWGHSIIPLIPLDQIQDVFRTEIYLENLDQNPFFGENPLNKSHLFTMYEGFFHVQSSGIYEALGRIKSLTSKPAMFDVVEIGYYGNTGLCVHNVFKSQDSYKVYKIVYCVLVLIVLAIVSATYIRILMVERKSGRNIATAGGNRNKEETEVRSITVKISLMIGTQLACWIPFILTVLYFQCITSARAPPIAFEVFFLVILPVNSLLNPVYYSGIYKNVVSKAWQSWRSLVKEILGL